MTQINRAYIIPEVWKRLGLEPTLDNLTISESTDRKTAVFEIGGVVFELNRAQAAVLADLIGKVSWRRTGDFIRFAEDEEEPVRRKKVKENQSGD